MIPDLKFDDRAFRAALKRFEANSKRSRSEVLKDQARLFVQDVILVTPPNKNFKANRKGGEAAISNDIRKILRQSKAKDAVSDPSGIHARFRDKHTGRVNKRNLKAKYRAANLAAYIKKELEKVGILASGWNAAASKLGAKVPDWISRHGTGRGSIKIAVSLAELRITVTNAVKFASDGVVFVTITLDPDTREVVSFCFDMAADEESIDDDDEETMHVVLGRFYIDTEADEDGLPVPFNTVAGNINMSVEPVTNADGRLCLDMVHTYLRDAVPTGFFNMEVFDTDEDGTPVEGCSSMFLSVGDADDPSNDGLTFQANNNYLEIVWGADQDTEYPIPAIKFTDSDGNVSKIDTGGLSFWDSNGTEDNPEVDLSMDGLNIWDMDGNGTLHDAGGISFWDSDASADNPQVDLSLDGLKIWDMDGDGMKIDATSLIFWDSGTSEDAPKFELDPDQLHFKDEDGDEANYDAGGITFDDTDGNTSNLDATNVTFTDSDGDSSTLDAGGLTFTSDSDTANLDATGLSIGESTALTDGDLDLGDDGTIEIGDSGSISVGSAILSDGDLNLGGDGSIETATLDASDKITCDTLEADTITYQGTDLDDYIDDSIRTALDSLSASIDCDSMTVTFSYSY